MSKPVTWLDRRALWGLGVALGVVLALSGWFYDSVSGDLADERRQREATLVANALGWAAHGASRPGQVRVWVDAAADPPMAQLCVADSGPGVREEDREHIFNAFFSTKDGGMGMGLAICRSIVEAHHGRIEVQQDPELGGARFTVWLPLDGAPTAPPPQESP